MKSQLKILYYDDALVFGGHEEMMVRHIAMLQREGVEQVIICPLQNVNLVKRLNEIPDVRVKQISLKRIPFQTLIGFIHLPRILKICSILQDEKPNVCIAVQGNIVISMIGVLAAKIMQIPVISYIPMAHKEKKSTLKGVFQELLQRVLFSLPDRFATISEIQKRNLISWGVNENKISLVPNFVKVPEKKISKLVAREKLSIDLNDILFLMIGRIEFKQKGQDLFLQAFHKFSKKVKNIKALIVGDGPDKKTLESKLDELELSDKVQLHPWSNDPNLFYAASDAIVMPSYYEGVPLVMIEAILNMRPVIGSAICGIKECLPDEWLFPCGDITLLSERLADITNVRQEDILNRTFLKFSSIFSQKIATDSFLSCINKAKDMNN
jgi:glycosyltransferase involved in cell wall biosynthesis